jgi:hypothetical protein
MQLRFIANPGRCESKFPKIAGAERSIMRRTWAPVKSVEVRSAAVGASNEI